MKKTFSKVIIFVYLISTTLFCVNIVQNQERQSESGFNMDATDFGIMCLSNAYPSMEIEMTDSRDNESGYAEGVIETLESKPSNAANSEQAPVTESTGEPRVLILHTHATESYLPSSEGNYHKKSEENTVRDVGNYLAQALEAKGIGVVHDKTLHDDPSYNDSYYRSYNTAENLLAKYPTVECVIDLHRDAMPGTSSAATVSIGGKTCARYSYVIGTAAETYGTNIEFVKNLNSTASSSYSGFTGNVIERGYRYNQELSTKYLLIEIGFNRNQIEECRNTAVLVGNILADTLNRI